MSDKPSRFVDKGGGKPFPDYSVDDLVYPKIPASERPSLFSLTRQAEALENQIFRLKDGDGSGTEIKDLQTELDELREQIKKLEEQSN